MNYIDRGEQVGGLDLGRQVAAHTWAVLGFRYGAQEQLKLFGVDSPYDSRLRRFLVGVEGQPKPWLDVTVLGGPETRSFASGTPAGFDRKQWRWFLDGTATISAKADDKLILTLRRYAQPSFTSECLYEDITYEAAWRHQWSRRWSGSAGLRLYGGDWAAPADRVDWILTPSAAVQWAFSPRLNFELNIAYDQADSKVPGTAGREFRRWTTGVGAKLKL